MYIFRFEAKFIAKSLSKDEKHYIETRRQEMRDQYYADRGIVDNQKQILKG